MQSLLCADARMKNESRFCRAHSNAVDAQGHGGTVASLSLWRHLACYGEHTHAVLRCGGEQHIFEAVNTGVNSLNSQDFYCCTHYSTTKYKKTSKRYPIIAILIYVETRASTTTARTCIDSSTPDV